MAPIRYPAAREVYRHASDDQRFDCGRACAQMIITSLVHGVSAGTTPSTVQKAFPASVIQDDLRKLEADPVDVAGQWFTHPDELVALLQGDAQLNALGRADWRVANCDTLPKLLSYIGLTLQRGMPAIINLRSADHWILVRSVDYDGGAVSFLQMLDPLNKRGSPGATAHTYLDGCAFDGTTWWDTIDLQSPNLATWSVQIGSFPPNNYQGRYVGMVYGPPPLTQQELLEMKRWAAKSRRRPAGPHPWERIREELKRIAALLGVPELDRILDPYPEVTIRMVRDIDGSPDGYTIASLFRKDLEYGLLAIFDPVDQAFSSLRLTADQNLTSSIGSGQSDDALWWTRRPLETLPSPYFPFRRETVNDKPFYRRLVDDYAYTPPSPD